jgi:hypothetical protein
MSALAHGAGRPTIHRIGGPRGDRIDGIDRRDYLFLLAAFPKIDPIYGSPITVSWPAKPVYRDLRKPPGPESPGSAKAPAPVYSRSRRRSNSVSDRSARLDTLTPWVPFPFARTTASRSRLYVSRSIINNRARSARESTRHARHTCSRLVNGATLRPALRRVAQSIAIEPLGAIRLPDKSRHQRLARSS